MKRLIVLAVALILGAGCDWGQSPETAPTTSVVFPGTSCAPVGALGVAADGTRMRCSGPGRESGVWRMEVRSS